MFEASVPVRFFDYFRIPYRVLPVDPWSNTLPQRHPLRWCGLARWAPSAASGRALRLAPVRRERTRLAAPRLDRARRASPRIDPDLRPSAAR